MVVKVKVAHYATLYCAIIVQRCAAQYYCAAHTTLCCPALYCTVLHCAVQFNTVPYSAAQGIVRSTVSEKYSVFFGLFVLSKSIWRTLWKTDG